ncbi:MAG TPA: hypothetical protein VIU39_13195 [Anaerolineales bacterium]
MLILLTVVILMLTAVALLVLRLPRLNFRYFWLTAVGGTLAAWVTTWLWLPGLPFTLDLPAWQPSDIFSNALSFLADGFSWPLAISLTTLAVAVLLTEVARVDLTNPLPWAGTLALTGVGVAAVTANNPLTLVLVWAALDLGELVALLRAVRDPDATEGAIIGFSTRLFAIGLALWANIMSVAGGSRPEFGSLPPQAGIFLLVAAGLRLGVLPLHLPFSSESALRRGVGTSMRLISAASSIVLLTRIPAASLTLPVTPVLMVLAAIAAVYAGWTWLRAPDDLSGRPFWVIGLAALAVAAALRGDPTGAAAWGCALVLCGGSLFLASAQHVWINRALLIAAFGVSALPFSLTGSGWQAAAPIFIGIWPFLLAAHALLLAGLVRHALRPGLRDNLASQPGWVRNVYPAGIGLLLLTILLLGIWGWDGAGRIGGWLPAAVSAILALALIWATPRVRLLNPIRAHWVRADRSLWLRGMYRLFSGLYRSLDALSESISTALEGEGGIMWTLLFLALFISFMIRGSQ